ncbi:MULTISPECIES: recombinase family protein [Bacillota]|nr:MULTISPECIES: recombinase family protein [Bacillota]MDZ5560739.1 recombinase family protein [Enterococcus cecorum]PWX10555.1 transposon DNA-invertase [Clostridium perfringens]PWX53985.1 transposon DNA-invertase [Clostridium perfringens]QUD74615.1 recombinase family protein [Clostridium perfringens]HAT4364606.1 recombinase family protein [Clostridium perfringens]
MLVGYARVSSDDQNLDRQLEEFKKIGVEKVFAEKKSGKNTSERTEFNKMLNFVREGDTIVFESLERLGRNSDEILDTVSFIDKNGMRLMILNLPILNTKFGDENLEKLVRSLVISILSWTAQNEREEIRRKQKQGIEIAKRKGIYKGKPYEYSSTAKNPQKRFIYNEIVRMLADGVPIKQIAERTGTNRSLVYRIKNRL